jgi:excisionase family DNA binding protein
VNEVTGTGDVYTMAEAARLKGVSYHTVSRAVRRGKLPATRLGRMALITSEDLRDWRPMRERAPRKYRRREPNLRRRPPCSISPLPSASSWRAGWHHYPRRSTPPQPGCREMSSLVS